MTLHVGMDTIGAVALWGTVIGLVLGVAIIRFSPPEVRVPTGSQLMRFGVGGTLLILVWWLSSPNRASPQVEAGIGIIAFGALVAGVVITLAARLGRRA